MTSLDLRSEIYKFVAGGLIAAGIGWLTGYLWLLLTVYAIAYLLFFAVQGWRALRWIQSGMSGAIPARIGHWRPALEDLKSHLDLQTASGRRMRRAVRRTSQLAHAIDQGIVVLRRDLSLRWWNTAARKQIDLQASDRGHSITSLIRDPEFTAYLEQKEFQGSIELSGRGQTGRWLIFNASHFGEGDVVLVITDITPLKNTERLRKEFVGNVSHELRTPITVLRGYLETLAESAIGEDPKIGKACQQMSDQVVRMQSLADDLLALSRLESQPKEVLRETVDLKPMLELIIDEAEVVSAGKHTFALECPDDACIMAQDSDIHSVMSNLVLNAVNHNPQGADIVVTVYSDADKVTVSVKDNGVGISADALPRLTERFYRTDTSRSSKAGGSGLGLAIVKHVVNRYGGELEIRSRLREGTECLCRFPLKFRDRKIRAHGGLNRTPA